jgi:predicted nucleic acid binding AN1-type Zn finger protein
MPCDKCKRKGIPIDCNYCPGKYCARCITLEEHKCEGMDKKKEMAFKILEKKLVHVEAPKIVKI